MEKINKVFLIILVICVVIVAIVCTRAIIIYKNKQNSDALKFKEEFESLNGVMSDVSEKEYLTVSIPDDNPIQYKTDSEILDVLKKEDAVVFFGYSNDPYCRSMIETFLSAAKKKEIKTIYYVDILDIRDSYEFNGSVTPNQTKKGTDDYYKIIKFLGKKLENYYVKDEEGNMYDTGVKRLYPATVVITKNGEVADIHTFTVESHPDAYNKLTKAQKKELKEIYEEMFDQVLTKTCTLKSC